jgi:hypothetical protein
MSVTRGDMGSARKTLNLHRRRLLDARAIAELIIFVIAPTDHHSAPSPSARMPSARGELHGIVEALNHDRFQAVFRRPIAELPALVLAPAEHLSGRPPRARIPGSDRELYQVVPITADARAAEKTIVA